MAAFGGCRSLPGQALRVICARQTGRAPGRGAVPATSCAQPTCLLLFCLGVEDRPISGVFCPLTRGERDTPGAAAGRGRGSKKS